MTSDVANGRILGQTLGVKSLGHCVDCDKSYPLRDRKCPIDGSLLVALPSESDEMVGRVLDGRFEIKERIGAGGMGTVYRAFQASVSRDVAVKIISSKVTPETIKRFMREARLCSRLAHPNTVTVHDFGQTHDGIVYLVMELIEGQTLTDWLQSHGPLPQREFLDFSEQLCDAIGAAHNEGIVHRDLKPCNVMIVPLSDKRHRVKVLDFGLAKSLHTETSKLSRGNVLMGTPVYMAPELIRAEAADESSDLYALGCTLYEMASGAPPFDADSMDALLAKQLEEDPAPLERTDLGTIPTTILALLSKKKEDRPKSAAQVRQALQEQVPPMSVPRAEALAQTIDSSLNLSAPAISKDKSPRRKSLLFPVFAGVVLSVGAIAFLLRSSLSDTKDPNPQSDPIVTVTGQDPDAAVVIVAHPSPPPTRPTQTRALEPKTVTLTLRSKPNSDVSINGEFIAQTPTTYLATKSQAQLVIHFSRTGFQSRTQTIVADADKVVESKLKRNVRAKGPESRPHKEPEKPLPSKDPEPIFR